MNTPEFLPYDGSPLLRAALHDRLLVLDYRGDGAYPYAQAEKREAEERVAGIASGWDDAARAEALERNERFLTEYLDREFLDARAAGGTQLDRLLAFAELQWLVDDSKDALRLSQLSHPDPNQPLFQVVPALFGQLTQRDLLLPITGANVTEAGGDWRAFRYGEYALFPHPDLRPARELLALLADLATIPRLRVSIAVDVYRVLRLSEVQQSLLADVWYGLNLTRENLDALDTRKPGTTTYRRRVPDANPALDFFHPLVSARFDWTARRDDLGDPVKRLYVSEFRPRTDRDGDLLAAVTNRELHAERDTAGRRFTHVDGKVRRYPTQTYKIDRATPQGDAGAHSHTRKLWRVDGPMTDEEWGDLVGFYFRDNELIAEYFGEVFPTMRAAPGTP